jgi:DNA repair exonuclease SbcCD ATPase subunit
LKEALEREQKIITAAKQAEQDIKKAKIEMQKKDAFFAQEIEKANRALKSRDLVVQKAKDGLSMILVKKDKEIKDLNTKISDLIGSQANTQQANQAQKLRALEQEKQSLTRLVEVYKNKLTSMATNLEKQNGGANPKKDEDVRKVMLEKQRAEVALQTTQKEMTRMKSRIDLDQAELTRLRGERKRLEEALKSALSTTGPVMATPIAKNDAHEKAIAGLREDLKQQTQKAGKYELNIKELEQKVAELTGMLAKSAAGGGAGDQATKGKMAQMDATVKKLSADFAAATNQLGEAKKEINKTRAENTALKNMLEKLKKDMEKAKAKPAAPGKKAA